MLVMMKKRDLGIEVLRCMLMLGVCLVHTLAAGIDVTERFSSLAWMRGLVGCSVDGFVFISGYYGIRFSWKKILMLYAVAIFYSTITGDPKAVAGGFWFLHAYAALTVIAPILNVSGGLPFLALIFGYGWVANLVHVRPFHLPLANLLGSHTWITLVGVYVAARMYRERELEKKLTMKACLLAIPTLAALNGVQYGYLGGYNSPFCLGLAVAVFTVFKKFRFDADRFQRLAVCVTWVVPSLFPIYIIHQMPLGCDLIRRIGECRGDFPLPDVVVGLCFDVGVFVVCLGIDSVRRLAVKGALKVCR